MHINFLILLPTKNLELVGVVCSSYALKESSDLLQSAKGKAQTLDCAPAFANPNS
jgi:hypothetical protein